MLRFTQFRFVWLVFFCTADRTRVLFIAKKSVEALSYSLDYRPCSYQHRERNGLTFGIRKKHLRNYYF